MPAGAPSAGDPTGGLDGGVVGGAQSITGSSVGGDLTANASGGTPGVAGAESVSAQINAGDARQAVTDEAVARTGVQDPRVTVEGDARVERVEEARDQASDAQARVGEAQAAAADPRAAATGEATFVAGNEVQAHTPAAVTQAQAQAAQGQDDVNFARSAESNPEAVAQGEVDSRVQEAEQEQESKLGVRGNVGVSGSVSTDPEKK
jgi:hypothetical protein